MSDLCIEADELKSKYRAIFLQVSEEINARLEKIKPDSRLRILTEEILKDAINRWVKILEYRGFFSCAGCAACCKLACSEFSPEELKQKAKSGDGFAQQFTSVFLPYENESDAQNIYPEYFELLKNKTPDEKVYFYHCPKVTEDNRCPDYENRPQICKDFPDNPITFLPKTCGFNKWKEEVEPTALMIRAIAEIVDYYKEKIKE